MKDFHFNKFGLCGLISSDLIWIRRGPLGPGIQIKRTDPMFSERVGKEKFYPVGFGWRVRKLGKIKIDKSKSNK